MITNEQACKWVSAVADPDKVPPYQNGFWTLTTDEVQAFAEKAATHGAEDMQRQCATLCMTSWSTDDERDYGQELAEAIRSLG